MNTTGCFCISLVFSLYCKIEKHEFLHSVHFLSKNIECTIERRNALKLNVHTPRDRILYSYTVIFIFKIIIVRIDRSIVPNLIRCKVDGAS